MDQREPPRIDAPEEGRPGGLDAGRRRFARLVPAPAVRGAAPNRLALAGIGLCAALAVLFAAGRGAVRYVHSRGDYQVAFREIVLDPPPPPWFLGGARAFLDGVAARAHLPATFSALDVDPARLTTTFRRSPWVKDVLRVEIGPPPGDAGRAPAAGPVRVRLAYRRPVAVARFEGGAEAVVDGEGVILPADEIDPGPAGPLIALHKFAPPVNPRPGEFWSRTDPRTGLSEPDGRVQTASRLSAFLRERLAPVSGENAAFRFVAVHSVEKGGAYVQVGRGLMFWWEDPVDGEAGPGLSAEARWEMLCERVRHAPPPGDGPEFEILRFTRDGAVVVQRRPQPARRPR